MKRNIITTCIVVVLCLVLFVSIFNIFKISNKSLDSEAAFSSKIINRNGVKYYPKQDIVTLLLMGIDRKGNVQSSGTYINYGRADFVSVLVFNETEKCLDVLQLNRDTITDIQVLGVNGMPAGKVKAQLALAHTYGTGLNDSCENVKKAVSDLLYSLNINYYLSLNTDTIQLVTDKLGGVKVNVTDDFSAVTPFIPKGEVVLTGEQALAFVSHRVDIADQLNISRMNRQNEFLKGLFVSINQNGNINTDFMLNLYNDISDYIVTDISTGSLSNLADNFANYKLRNIYTPSGENVLGDEFYEFYINSEDLDKTILNLFYSEK